MSDRSAACGFSAGSGKRFLARFESRVLSFPVVEIHVTI
jgi:hypothetical protein